MGEFALDDLELLAHELRIPCLRVPLRFGSRLALARLWVAFRGTVHGGLLVRLRETPVLTGELLSPIPQVRFARIEPRTAVLGLGLDDQVHVRVLAVCLALRVRFGLLRVQRHHIAVLVRKPLPCELLCRLQHLLRRCSRRHREHDVERLPGRLFLPIRLARTARMGRARDFAVIERPLVDEFGGRLLALENLTGIGLKREFAVPVEVLEMRLHAIGAPPAAGNLDHDFLGTRMSRAHVRGPTRS